MEGVGLLFERVDVSMSEEIDWLGEGMNKKEFSEKLNRSKKKLQAHMEKFNLLRAQGKSKEALEELKIALNFANETLEYSNSILHQIHNEFVSLPKVRRQNIIKKIHDGVKSSRTDSSDPLLNIQIPDKKTVH